MPYIFNTPTVSQGPIGGERLFQFFEYDVGVSILKYGNEYFEVMYPNSDDLSAADAYYLGGYENVVSDEEATDLTNAGYGDYLVEI